MLAPAIRSIWYRDRLLVWTNVRECSRVPLSEDPRMWVGCSRPSEFSRSLSPFFHLKRVDGSEVRRGDVFIQELIPTHAIALVARWVHNEKYLACPMHANVRTLW